MSTDDFGDPLAVADRLCHGRLTEAEREQLVARLVADPELGAAVRQQVWIHRLLQAEACTDPAALDARVDSLLVGDRHSAVLRLDRAVRGDLQRRQWRRRATRTTVLASAAALLLGIAWLIIPAISSTPASLAWRDAAGVPIKGPVFNGDSPRTLSRDDGSQLTLGALAHVDVRADDRIDLLAGSCEAVIVPQAPGRNLQIQLDEHRVSVVGTRFLLQRNGPQRSVQVSEGSVLVDHPEFGRETVTAGNNLIAIDPTIGRVAQARARSASPPAWQLPAPGPQPTMQAISLPELRPLVWASPELKHRWSAAGLEVANTSKKQIPTWLSLPRLPAADYRIQFDIRITILGRGGGIRIGTRAKPLHLPGYPARIVPTLTSVRTGVVQRYELQFRAVGLLDDLGVIAEGCMLRDGKPLMRVWCLNPDQTVAVIGINCTFELSNVRIGPLTIAD